MTRVAVDGLIQAAKAQEPHALDDPTNLHYHGLNVSPLGRSDNIFIHVGNGEMFDYEFNTGPAGDQNPEVTLATVVSEGPAEQPILLPAKLPRVEDLRKQPVARKREIVFTESPGKFFINGKQFDMNRIDTTVNLGDIEEWTIRNASDEMHTFHVHQLDFQVVEVNGQQAPFRGVQDNVNIPVRGVVKILLPGQATSRNCCSKIRYRLRKAKVTKSWTRPVRFTIRQEEIRKDLAKTTGITHGLLLLAANMQQKRCYKKIFERAGVSDEKGLHIRVSDAAKPARTFIKLLSADTQITASGGEEGR